ncbi:MAG: DUF928 domain-containing protein [Pelatocladus maniniholoensis HA4357-MV3]|jgi:hypothetical protein|uniref:DUF928 domain-containing protein n=1 Tax=Pelatocladus maniniholoensis HA4357-MV3 TaxID=1117104 RepID=A0A9E3H5Y2_9NOST|nr:DUF928 domain-containing protein [Pelatocladus maniniholoensis HA4357-MV3]BAZ69928.1 hypothetical protein NIES4106_47090 [Fischerella sp. NIES-4106]
MTHTQWLLHKVFNPKVLTICALTIPFSFSQVTLAAYKPPPDQKPPSGYTESSGTRGRCKASDADSLTLLAPVTHIGQTTSTHPTFAWFVSNHQRVLLEFSIYELSSNEQLKLTYKSRLQSSPGIMKVSVPETLPGLALGKNYLWQVEILCDFNHPSRNLLATADIAIVPIPGSLQDALYRKRDRTQRASLYAEAGMWYDALGEALANSSDGQLGKLAINLLKDLANLEKSPQIKDLYLIALEKHNF